MQSKKAKAENYYQANKEKPQKRLREYYTNPSEVKRIKERNYANIRNKKICQMKIQKEGNSMKHYYYK